jgi:hypothetical protein
LGAWAFYWTSEDFLAEMDAGARATRFFTNGTIFAGATTGVDLVRARINQGLARLQTDSSVRLRAAALLALYRHCAQSIGLGQILTNVNNEIAAYPSAIAAAVPAVQRYLEFQIFHQRSKDEQLAMHASDSGCTQPGTDFHDALSRLNQFPALLRPLGLAFDLEVAFPDLSSTWVTVMASNRVSLAPIGIVPLVTNGSLVQSASGQPFTDFFATPRGSDLITNRYLYLQATGPDDSGTVSPLFTFVSEDTDGSAQKTSLQSQAESRTPEYGSAAGDDSGADAMPSARTVGVSLLYANRKQRTQDAIARNATLGDPIVTLFAEDLVLGYRVDVQRNGKWLSLNSRASTYDVVNAQRQRLLTWRPTPGLELAADEGFISPMATSAPGTDGNPIVQVHQSIFTWTGWSLSIKPLFNSINGAGPTEDNCDYPPLCHVRPKYSLAQNGQLPPLRFGQSNTFRCRAVDLVGNSVSVTTSNQPAGALKSHTMERLEPIRPPHILLNEPLPRVSLPGAQADLVVVRDGHGSSGRTLVAPREPLRLAELHDQLRSATLPGSAFPNTALSRNSTERPFYAAFLIC